MRKLPAAIALASIATITSHALATFSVTIVQPPAVGYQVIDSSLKLDNAGAVFGNAFLPGSGNYSYFSEFGDVSVLGSQLSNGSFQSFNDVSGNGIIAGSIATGNGLTTGFEQSGSTPTLLNGPQGIVGVLAVNDSGEAVGVSANPSNVTFDYSALLWQNGNASQIKVTFGTGPQVDALVAINDNGTVAGVTTQTTSLLATAFTWDNGKATILPSLGSSSIANAINSAGVVVGTSIDNSEERQAVEWSGGEITELVGTGYADSDAVAINDSGEIVGSDTSDSGVRSAFLYEGGQTSSLDDLLPASDGYHFLDAMDINNSGQILALATHDGNEEDVLLTPDPNDPSAIIVAQIAPVPEPTTSMLLVSVIGSGLMRRQRRGPRNKN